MTPKLSLPSSISRLRRSSAAKTSDCTTKASASNLVNFRFSRMQHTAAGFFSTKTASFAPLLSASIPIAPLPENRSRKRIPYSSSCIILKSVSLIRSVVGLVSIPGTVLSASLLALPAITLIISSFVLCFFYYKGFHTSRQAEKTGKQRKQAAFVSLCIKGFFRF